MSAVGGGTAPLEAVIGLEIHVQLATRTKLFCADAARFGAPPNTLVCPVCAGLPGALPVLNRRAVELAAAAALGLGCTVHPRSGFARKHYFYPDLPKGYQITQHRHPLATGGMLELPADGGAPARVRIRRVHLEEDAGRSLHYRDAGSTAVDLNRAGVPLIEIVTEPDLASPAQARAFLSRLKQLLEYLRVSDCSMEQGSLRVDANVSVRPEGGPPGGRTELKNLNSFSGVERALAWELERQRAVVRAGRRVEPATLLWDAGRGEGRVMRAKEGTGGYRFLAEPDLGPLVVDPALLDQASERLTERPWDRAARLAREHGLSAAHAGALTTTRELADYYEALVAAGSDAREAVGWTTGELLAELNARGCSLDELGLPPAELAGLLGLVADGTLTRTAAREVLRRMLETGRSAGEIVESEGWARVREEDSLARWVDEAGAANPDEVARFRAGEDRLLGYFVGRVMRLSAGRADPKRVAVLVRERLGA